VEIFNKIVRRGLAAFTLFSIELIIIWVAFLGSLFAFLFITKEVFHLREEEFDRKVFLFLTAHITESMTSFMEAITFFASRNFIAGAALMVFFYFIFIKRHAWYSLKIPVVALGSITLNLVLKHLFNRPRPLLPHLVKSSGLSFPSGHAMISISFYGLLIYLIWEQVESKYLKYTLIALLLILIHLIGFSRVYLRVHYASDVMAGFALGTLWLILSIFLINKIEKYSRSKLAPVIEAS